MGVGPRLGAAVVFGGQVFRDRAVRAQYGRTGRAGAGVGAGGRIPPLCRQRVLRPGKPGPLHSRQGPVRGEGDPGRDHARGQRRGPRCERLAGRALPVRHDRARYAARVPVEVPRRPRHPGGNDPAGTLSGHHGHHAGRPVPARGELQPARRHGPVGRVGRLHPRHGRSHPGADLPHAARQPRARGRHETVLGVHALGPRGRDRHGELRRQRQFRCCAG